jgi:hypothetical protein
MTDTVLGPMEWSLVLRNLMRLDRERAIPAARTNGQSTPLPDQHDRALAPGHVGVEQVARQHGIALRRQRDHDRRVLLSLSLMDRGRLGQHQLVQLAKTVGDRPPIGRHDEFALHIQPGLGAGTRRPGPSGKWSR